jgi:fructose-1-phosphate kinase PfkB-like protein
MVYTVTLNPALDWMLWIERIQPYDANRIEQEQRYAGCKNYSLREICREPTG